MAGDEYSAIIPGGLKLKGSKPAGIVKKKKKKDKDKSGGSSTADKVEDAKLSALQSALAEEERAAREDHLQDREGVEDGNGEGEREEDDGTSYGGKTEAERKWEETRRKRLDERLKKEGVKTHKQRVEELNKYLSNLSEHHDMPRIGPG